MDELRGKVNHWDVIRENIREWIACSGRGVEKHLETSLSSNPSVPVPKIMSDSVLALNHTAPKVRSGALKTLSGIAREETLTVLEAATRFHPVSETAACSIYALFNHSKGGTDRAISMLLAEPALLESRETYYQEGQACPKVSVKYVVTRILKHHLLHYSNWLVEVFQHSTSNSDAGYALTALAYFLGESARPLILEGLARRRSGLHQGILNAIKVIGYSRSVDLLTALLRDHVAAAQKGDFEKSGEWSWALHPDGGVSEGTGGGALFVHLEMELEKVQDPSLEAFRRHLTRDKERYYEARRAAEAAKH